MSEFKIFDDEQERLSDIILENNDIAPLSELYSREIQELGIGWSYYSGKIEGNTYSLIETETLIKDGITSPKKYDDARMLKNLYNTFISEVEYIKRGNKEIINKRLLMELHSNLISELIDNRERGLIRKRVVQIIGTEYTPPQSETEIEESLDKIMEIQDEISNPLERAIYLHCNIAKIQPFVDGNKRVSRLIESIVLMNEDIVPIFSTNNFDITSYRAGLLYFYETGNYTKYSDYFLEQKIRYLQKYTQKDLLKNTRGLKL